MHKIEEGNYSSESFLESIVNGLFTVGVVLAPFVIIALAIG